VTTATTSSCATAGRGQAQELTTNSRRVPIGIDKAYLILNLEDSILILSLTMSEYDTYQTPLSRFISILVPKIQPGTNTSPWQPLCKQGDGASVLRRGNPKPSPLFLTISATY
jgi:hypothetical protein